MTVDDLRTFMIQWNNRFPIDRWYRKKHNIAFLSPEHRECSFIAQMLEYQEEKLFQEAKEEASRKDNYVPNVGQWLKESDSTEINENDIEAFRQEAMRLYELEEQKD